MASSRSLLVVALVALLCAGAVAERQLLKSGKGGKSKALWGHKCAKAFAGCAVCKLDEEGKNYCDSCSDPNASVDEETGACVCNSDDGYGTLTWDQYYNWWKGQKSKKSKKSKKHFGKYGVVCYLCEDYSLEAVDGVCQ